MHIQKVIIGNYRSLHKEELRCHPLNIIFGPNNVGKSNILRALKLFFNPLERTTREDLNKSVKLKSIKIAAKMILPAKQKKSSIYQYVYNDKGKNILFIERRHKADQKAKYFNKHTRKEIFPKDLNPLSRFFREKFLFFDRNIESDLNFGELEKIFGKTFNRQISDGMIKKASGLIMPQYEKFDKYINSKSQHLLENFREVFNLQKKSVRFTCAPNKEELLSKIRLELDQEDVVNDLRNKGQGIKNIALFIFRGFLHRFSNKIVAIEELENNLHPSFIRILLNYINSILREGKKQFFITTHNLQLLNSVDPKYLCKVSMEDGKTKIIQPYLTNKKINDFYDNIYTNNRIEALFARKVIIAEGESDLTLLPLLSNKISINKKSLSFDLNNIQVIGVGGDGLHKPVALLKEFAIDWLILCDEDKWANGGCLGIIEKLQLDRAHPQKFKKIKKIFDNKQPLSEDTQQILYQYFNIICLNGKIENLVVNKGNSFHVRNILKKCVPGKYNIVKGNSNFKNDDIKICLATMEQHKPLWAVTLGRNMSDKYLTERMKRLIRVIVEGPKRLKIFN